MNIDKAPGARHMLNPRKRPYPEPSQPIEASQPRPKKERICSSVETSSAAFWDRLSKVWLTKRALQELDRRNDQIYSRSSPSAHRPVTRSFSKLKNQLSTIQITHNGAACCFAPSAEKEIQQFARHGGPDLSSLRGYCRAVSSMSSQSSRRRKRGSASTPSTSHTTSTKSTGPYDRAYQQHLVDNCIFPCGYEYPDGGVLAEPSNESDIQEILERPRASLSPSRFTQGDFKELVRADANAFKEKQVSEYVIPLIEGKIPDQRSRSGGVPFCNLEPITDANLKPGNPDVYYGARPEQLSRTVRNELSKYIIPSTQDDLPVAPNFFLAVKGPDGTNAVAQKQACFDGALGARAMHHLSPVYDNKARTITSTYSAGHLQMYTSHLTEPSTPGARPAYHMTRLQSFSMVNKLETCREGIRAYRNARDWTAELRNEAIKEANERAIAIANVSLGAESSLASNTSTESCGIEPLSQQPSEPQLSGDDSQTTDDCETENEETVRKKRSKGKRLRSE